jgi:hypothetical protein
LGHSREEEEQIHHMPRLAQAMTRRHVALDPIPQQRLQNQVTTLPQESRKAGTGSV